MTKEIIDQLSQDIENEKKALEAKKILLKQLKAEERKHVPFGKTKFGRAYFGAIKAVTKPLAALNQRADDLMNCPEKLQAESLLHRADKLKAAADKLQDNSHKKAKRLAVLCAEHVLEIEQFLERNPEVVLKSELSLMTQVLDNQVQRLRPKKDEKKESEVKALMKTLEVQTQGA